MDPSEAFELLAFASTGAVSATQDLVQRVRAGIEGADAELVAEETLVLVSVATSRAVAVGLREASAETRASVAEVLLDLPFTYRDYLMGRALLSGEGGDPQRGAAAEAATAMRERLARKRRFYVTHLPEGRFPGPRALDEKMPLWMGRISPPKLPEMPEERLEKLALVDPLVAHLKVVLAAARRRAGATQGQPAGEPPQ